MSDATLPPSPFVPERALTPLQVNILDPLAGDWSEGLRGPVRALDVPAPLLIPLDGLSQPASLVMEPPVAPVADEVEAPDAWDAAAADPLESAPPPDAPSPSVIVSFSEPPQEPLAPLPDIEAAAAAPVPLPGAPAEGGPVPLPAPAAPEEPIVELRAEDAADDTWSTPPAAEPVEEWIPDAAGDDWEEVKAAPEPAVAEVPAADWGTLSSGPDWTAPAADAEPAAAAPAEDVWSAPPPPAVDSTWDALPPAPAEDAPAEPAAFDWAAPEAPPPAPAPAWNAPAVGASALEQLDSEPVEPTPGAAAQLFGSVPAGASLAAEDDPFAPSAEAPVELGAAEELGPPEELAAPEEVLRPVPVDFDDPDLLVPIDEEEPPPAPRAQPLAVMHPPSFGALAVGGEHRVAVHTRGGRTRRGSVTDIDLGKSQFSLIPQGGGEPEPVYHAEVKAIFFMLAPGEKPAQPDGGKVRVTFADGRSIEGHRDGPDAKHGFFLVPLDAARTNTRRIYVAREATTDIRDG